MDRATATPQQRSPISLSAGDLRSELVSRHFGATAATVAVLAATGSFVLGDFRGDLPRKRQLPAVAQQH